MLNRFLASLNVSRKFILLLSVQALLLVVITSLGWLGIQESKSASGQLIESVQKSKMIGKALNDSNVMRTVQISMLGAAKNDAYQAKRAPREQEYEGRVQEILKQFPTLPWTEAERPLALLGMAKMKEYMDGFAPLMAAAKARPETEAVPEMMDGNVAIQRDAREALEKLQDLVLKASGDAVRTSDLRAKRRQAWILGIAVAGLAAGIGFVRLVGRQITGGVKDLERTMSAMHHGDLTVQSHVEGQDELNHISNSLNLAMAQLREDLQAMAQIAEQNASSATQLAATGDQIDSATGEISRGADQQRLAGGRGAPPPRLPGGDGPVHRHGPEQRRQRRTPGPGLPGRQRGWPAQRRGIDPGHGRDPRQHPEGVPDHRGHRRDRPADQPAQPQRCHRGGQGRPAGQGLRGGGG